MDFSALTDLITTLEDEPMFLLKKFFEKLESLEFCLMEEKSKQGILRVCVFFKEHITCWIKKINDPSCVEFRVTDLAQIWGIISCYSYMTDSQANPSLLMDFVEALDRCLMGNSGIIL